PKRSGLAVFPERSDILEHGQEHVLDHVRGILAGHSSCARKSLPRRKALAAPPVNQWRVETGDLFRTVPIAGAGSYKHLGTGGVRGVWRCFGISVVVVQGMGPRCPS